MNGALDDPSAAAPTRPVRMMARSGKAEARPDGTILLSSSIALEAYPESWNQRLLEWAERAPDRIFLTEADGAGGRRAISYAETLAAVRAIGEGLCHLGLDSEKPLAILSENSIDCALVTLAAMWIGVAASPISPAYALKASDFSKLAGVISALSPGAVYVADGDRYAAAVSGAVPAELPVISGGAPLPGRSSIALADLKATLPGALQIAANQAVNGDTVAKILFTSGSSGPPKPVILPHRMLAANRQQHAQAFAFMLEEPPVMVDWLPWHHTFGGNNNFGFALWCGGTFHIDDGLPVPDGIERTVALLREYPPTLYLNTPGGFAAMMPHLLEDADFAEQFFSRLKLVQSGGAVFPAHIWRALDEVAVATTGNRILVVSGLGSTECGPTPVMSTWEQNRQPEAGLPVPGVTAKLVPYEGTWELRLQGPCVTPGYWRRPDLTAQSVDAEGFFITGDAVRPLNPLDFAEGLLFDGRITDNFKLLSGTWVQTGAVRNALIGALAPLVRDAVITGHDRAELGAIAFPDMSAARTLVGMEDGADEAVLAHPKLREWVAERLAKRASEARGGSERIARLVITPEAPSFDNGELTDKGVAAARAVLARRPALVEALHADMPRPDIYVV